MLPVHSRGTPPTLQHPPHDKEQQQRMLHYRQPHIGIRNYAPDGGEWEGKKVVICPLPMRQEIDDAMSEHADKEREHRSIEHSKQDEEGTNNHKRMHGDRDGMQHRVVQERMEFRSHGRVREIFQSVCHKAQG